MAVSDNDRIHPDEVLRVLQKRGIIKIPYEYFHIDESEVPKTIEGKGNNDA